MNVRYRIEHETRYKYEAPVSVSRQLLHLSPRALPWQTVLSSSVEVLPEPSEQDWRDDYFGNHALDISIATPHDELVIIARADIALFPHAPDPGQEPGPPWETVRTMLHAPRPVPPLDAAQVMFESPQVPSLPGLARYAAPSFAAGRPLLEAVADLNHRIHTEFSFDAEATTIATPLAEVLATKRGVCQDFAHLMIGCLRSLGLAARYVSGYLLTTPPPGKPRMIGADASHAWISVYLPEHGWIDFDPTNDCLPDTHHITVAWGRDFSDVTPVRGVILGSGDQELEVKVTVMPLDEACGVDTATPAPE